MGVLKKLQRFIILIVLHTQRVVRKYFILWSFKIFLPEAEDNKFFLNDGKKTINLLLFLLWKTVIGKRIIQASYSLLIPTLLITFLGDVLPAKPFSQIPGPLHVPLFGSQWLYSWIGPYFLDKLHLANEGKYFKVKRNAVLLNCTCHVVYVFHLWLYYLDKYRKYGPVVKEHFLWNFPIIHLYDKHDIESVLKYPSKYPIRPGLEAQIFYRKSRPDRYKSECKIRFSNNKIFTCNFKTYFV